MYLRSPTVDSMSPQPIFHGPRLVCCLRRFRRTCFTFRGECYCLNIIPTGQRHCPALAQALSAPIGELVEREVQRRAGVAEVAIRVLTYIDNFYLLADSTSTLEMAEKVLLELCDEARIVINREQQPESRRHTNIFIGIEWNERDLTCTLSPKSAKKLTSLLSFTQLWYHTPVPLRQVLEVFGFLIFAARVTGQGQAPLYGVLKFLRRNGKKNVSEICWVRPSVISSFNEYIVNLAYTPARVLLAPLDEECGQSRVITLFTDACPSG